MPGIRDKSMRHKIRSILDKEITRTFPITWRVFLFFTILGIVSGFLTVEVMMLIGL